MRLNNDSNIDDTNMETCKGCGRLFKKGRGLKIHHTKSGCLKTNVPQRKTHKSEAEVTQDSNHSSDSSHVGPRETTIIVAEDKELVSGLTEPNQTAEEKEGDRGEEEIEIQVEEEVYKEVQEWIVKMEVGVPADRKKKKQKRKEADKNNKDIRTWLVSQNVDEGKKDSRTILVRADAEEEQEDTKTQDSRTVVGRQDGEQAGQKTRESQRQKSNGEEGTVEGF